MSKLEEQIKSLNIDLLNMMSKYEKMGIYELGFGAIRLFSVMLFDLASSEGVAIRTILAAMEEGRKDSIHYQPEKKECQCSN